MVNAWQRFDDAFSDSGRNYRQTIYVYRLGVNDEPVKPYLFKACGQFDRDTELLCYLQEAYGAGDYRVLVRDGSTMVYSGDVSVARPLLDRSVGRY